MSQLVLYGTDISPPVRACLLTLKALELPYEYKVMNLYKSEHLSDEFKKRNPQHTVPVLDDNGTWLWDSHAICSYLVDKYGKSDSLYPKDLAKRAVVNQRMYFDASILFMSIRNITMSIQRYNNREVSVEKIDNIREGYTLMEAFLANHQYLTGEEITIADFCCAATISTMGGIIHLDEEKFPKTVAWLKRLTQLPYYEEANGKGVKEYQGLVKPILVFPSNIHVI